MKSKRSSKNLIISPKHQVRIAFYFVFLFSLAFISLILYFSYSIRGMVFFIRQTYEVDSDLVLYFENYLKSFMWTILINFICVTAVGFLIWLKVSHRIFGPLVPISRHIRELQQGNYSSRVHLRKDDFMLDLKDDLNILAETLQKTKETN